MADTLSDRDFEMGIRNWRDALAERLGRLDITAMAQAEAIQQMQEVIAKADQTKLDVDDAPGDSSQWTNQMHRAPSLNEMGAFREGTSASGRAAPELIRRFSDLAEGDKNTELYAQLGEMLKSASVIGKMLQAMDKQELRKSTHLTGVVKNLIAGLREVAKALGADDAEDEEDEESSADSRADGDLSKARAQKAARVRKALESEGIPSVTVKEMLSVLNPSISTPPDFSMIKAAADEVTRARDLLDSGELSTEQSARLQTAITRVQAARAGAVVPSAALAAAITVLQNPYDTDVRMGVGGNV